MCACALNTVIHKREATSLDWSQVHKQSTHFFPRYSYRISPAEPTTQHVSSYARREDTMVWLDETCASSPSTQTMEGQDVTLHPPHQTINPHSGCYLPTNVSPPTPGSVLRQRSTCPLWPNLKLFNGRMHFCVAVADSTDVFLALGLSSWTRPLVHHLSS